MNNYGYKQTEADIRSRNISLVIRDIKLGNKRLNNPEAVMSLLGFERERILLEQDLLITN